MLDAIDTFLAPETPLDPADLTKHCRILKISFRQLWDQKTPLLKEPNEEEQQVGGPCCSRN